MRLLLMIIGLFFRSGTRRLSLSNTSASSLVHLQHGRGSIHLPHGDGLRLQLDERGGRLLEPLPESLKHARPHRGHYSAGGARWQALLAPAALQDESGAEVGSSLLQQCAGQDC